MRLGNYEDSRHLSSLSCFSNSPLFCFFLGAAGCTELLATGSMLDLQGVGEWSVSSGTRIMGDLGY